MTNTKGYRRGTRYLFSKKFRKHGVEHLSTYLRVYKRGDLVNIKGNGAFQKGMPFKFYHGRTGRVFNVTPHALGVIVNKRVRHRIIAKRIHVRIEHVQPSRCRQEFVRRVQKIAEQKAEAKKTKTKIQTKRIPTQPGKGHFVRVNELSKIQNLAPIPFEFIA